MQIHFINKEGKWFDEAKTLYAAKSLLRSSGLKFLLYTASEDTVHLVLAAAFSDSLEHAQVAEQVKAFAESWKLVGAGYMTSSGCYYKSDSCMEKYGFDRPSDEKEGRELLLAAKTVLVGKGIMCE